jgi:hypothetical protein
MLTVTIYRPLTVTVEPVSEKILTAFLVLHRHHPNVGRTGPNQPANPLTIRRKTIPAAYSVNTAVRTDWLANYSSALPRYAVCRDAGRRGPAVCTRELSFHDAAVGIGPRPSRRLR